MSIVQDWAAELGLRHQGVLVSAVRGPDGVAKTHPLKTLVAIYRGCVLVPHCGDLRKASSYMTWFEDEHEFRDAARAWLSSMDEMSLHYVLHFVHAAEIVGYFHPASEVRDVWAEFYRDACRKMHVAPESFSALSSRLDADEETFKKDQVDT